MIQLTQPVAAMIQAIVAIGLISIAVDVLMQPSLKRLPVQPESDVNSVGAGQQQRVA